MPDQASTRSGATLLCPQRLSQPTLLELLWCTHWPLGATVLLAGVRFGACHAHPQQARWRCLLLLKELCFYASMLFSLCRQATKCSPLLCFTSISLTTILSAATLTPLKLRQQNGCLYYGSLVTV